MLADKLLTQAVLPPAALQHLVALLLSLGRTLPSASALGTVPQQAAHRLIQVHSETAAAQSRAPTSCNANSGCMVRQALKTCSLGSHASSCALPCLCDVLLAVELQTVSQIA